MCLGHGSPFPTVTHMTGNVYVQGLHPVILAWLGLQESQCAIGRGLQESQCAIGRGLQKSQCAIGWGLQKSQCAIGWGLQETQCAIGQGLQSQYAIGYFHIFYSLFLRRQS